MSETIACTLPLARWQGDRGIYHLVTICGEAAEAIAMHERLLKLELGTKRGFGSVKVMARVRETEWRTSVFPQKAGSEWVLLIAKKVMRAEDLAEGDAVALELELL